MTSVLFKAIDILGTIGALVGMTAWTGLRVALSGHRQRTPAARKLLVLDMSYTLDAVRARQLDEPITARDLNGFFSHVWSVHPCATVIAQDAAVDTFGTFIETSFAVRHSIIEGKVGRFGGMRRFPTTNFLMAQWELLRYLRRLIVREGISAIRAGDPYYLGLLALVLCWTTRVPLVVRIALNYDTFFARMGHLAYPRLFRWRRAEQIVSRFVLRRTDLVAGSNQDSLDFALANGARPTHSTVFRVGNLIHKAHFQPPELRPDATPFLEELGLTARRFTITVCRLERLKHLDDVLRAVHEVRSRGLDLSALIVGDGRLRGELATLAESLAITDKVVFAGNRSQEWIAAVLPHAAVVVSPHMGRGLTEAQLSGVPAVAYDVEWQAEIVISGQTGELVEYRNWRQLALGIETICSDPAYAASLGARARAFTLDMMDPEKLSRHEQAAYASLFARLTP